MSVYYEIREHLTLLPGSDPSAAYLAARRLAMLGADMLMEGGTAVDTLRVSKGARAVSFSGCEVDPSLKEAVSLLLEAMQAENTEPAEMDLAYEYRWSEADEAFSEGLEPFGLCRLFDAWEDRELEKISYVMWNKADGTDGMGTVVRYGKDSSGTLCRGTAPFLPIDVLPPEAAWYTEESTFAYDGSPFTAEIAEACRLLSIAAGNPSPEEGETFTVEGQLCQSYPDLSWDGEDEGEYYLNFVSLPDKSSADAFTEAMVRVLRATGREAYEAELLDIHARLPRLLRCTVTADGRISYAMTAV